MAHTDGKEGALKFHINKITLNVIVLAVADITISFHFPKNFILIASVTSHIVIHTHLLS